MKRGYLVVTRKISNEENRVETELFFRQLLVWMQVGS